jgi:hypothetical protein
MSVMDSSKHGMSKSEIGAGDDKSMSQDNYEYKVSIQKIKNVFNLLITETPFLIDDKAFQESEGKSQKERYAINIDSIRKSLGIDNMDDVELLVLIFYEFADKLKKEQEEDDGGSQGSKAKLPPKIQATDPDRS